MAQTRTPVRKARNATVRGLTASARRLDLHNAYEKRVLKLRQEWQAEAWQYYDEVPEIKFCTHFLGNLAAKLRLFVGVRTAPDEHPVAVDDIDSPIPPEWQKRAIYHLSRLRAERGGQSEICRMLNMNLEIPGECFLIGWAAYTETSKVVDPETGLPLLIDHPEEWDVKSISEVFNKDGRWRVKNDPNAKDTDPESTHDVDPDRGDVIIRVWLRHPQWSNMADSLMRGVLGECRSLTVLSQQILAEANSHLSAGILAMSNELSFGRDTTDEAPGDGQDAAEDPFDDMLFNTMASAVEDPSSPASLAPLVLRGPSDLLKPDVLRLISLARSSDAYLDDRIEKRILRIARGLNVPVEVATGLMETTFANAQQVHQDIFDQHMEPRAVLIVDALTVGFLAPELEAEGCPPDVVDQIVVWYDPKALIRQPDAIEKSDSGFDRMAISAMAWRAKNGYNDADAPTREEILERIVFEKARAQLGPEISLALLKLMGVPIEVEAMPGPSPAPVLPASWAEQLDALAAAAPKVTPRALSGVPTPGRQLVDLDIELRTRLLIASSDALERTLEKAGNRLRSKLSAQQRQTVRQVPAYRIAATLGRAVVASIDTHEDDLLAADWGGLETQFVEWVSAVQEQALTIVGRVVRLRNVDALKVRQADDLRTAWGWMRDALTGLAHTQLYDPDPSAPPVGEGFSGRVPPGLVRLALARAGGRHVGLSAGAWVAVGDEGTGPEPAGGVGVGDLTMGALSDGGGGVDGWTWVYGPALRLHPFDAHETLDGTEFVNFDDDVLAVQAGDEWVGDFYLPGDHDGCMCDVEPTIVDGGTSAAVSPDDEGGPAPDVLGGFEFDPTALGEPQGGTHDYALWNKDQRAEMAERIKALESQLSPAQLHALEEYTGAGYVNMNALQRDTESWVRNNSADLLSIVESRVQHLDAAFAKAIPATDNAVVWRGVRYDMTEIPKAGELLSDPGFLSTSLGRHVAEGFSKDWLYQIDLPAGQSRLFGTERELEMILPRDTPLRVISVIPPIASVDNPVFGGGAVRGVIHVRVETR